MPSANVPRTRSCRRVLPLLLLVLLSACGDSGTKTPAGPGTDQPDDGSPVAVAFADTALEQAVRLALSRPAGDLSLAALHSLTTLSASGRGIADLHGIGQLDSLTALDLSNNRIVDLTPLDSLAHLQMLDLSWNQVSDLTPLSGLAELQSLALEGNQVTDLTSILGLPALATLDLTGNPLTEEARITQLAALRDRGIQVSPGVPGTEGDTPSGSIAFASDRGGTLDIYVADADGTHLVNLTRGSTGNNWEPVWSPDWTRIAFTSDREGGFAPHLYVMDADGSDVTRLVDEPGWNPRWSPQGDQLAYVRSEGGGIVVLDLASSSSLSLTAGMAGQEYLPCWSPDGTRIAFTSDGEGSLQVWVVAADGGAAQRVTEEAGSAVALAWSPDGSGILYARGRAEWLVSGLPVNVIRPELNLWESELWVVELAGRQSLRLLGESQPACGATWSPDGRYLAFTSRQGGDFDIYLSLPGVGVPFNLTSQAAADITPSWSPRSVAEYAAGLPTEEGPGPALDPEEEVVFADSALEAAVRAQVGLWTGPIRRRDVELIDSFYHGSLGISDLRGIEALARVVWLSLNDNRIRDLSPLSELTTLRTLFLDNNQIFDLAPLAGLRGVTWLHLSGNQIEDVTPLAGLVGLSDLQLGRNPIRDISPLAALRPKWTLSLSLSRTQVSDLRPLLQIPGPNDQTPALTEWKVVGCPLDDYSRNTVIPALKERGTQVTE
ncbi:MAG: leucine-rich repeat domain-containing protein [Candidatus Latescibacterota bacterium]|jgi:Tol biopolymer transport system component/Leucine-rich repeat (LRR) protein